MRGIYSLLLLIALLTSCNENANREPTGQPNVIIVFIDDEGYGDVGSYGATGFETPNLDQMASQGMRFTNFYAAQPVCSASRAGLITGCYPNRIGFSGALFPFDSVGINSAEYTLGEMFQDLGYATACFGKWHLGWQQAFLPLQHGFDEYLGVPYSNDMWPHSNVTGEKLARKSAFPALPLIEGNEVVDTIDSMEDQDTLTTLYTEKAVDFINRNADQPFFLYLPHTMAHIPLGVSDKFRGKSEQGLYGDVMMEIDWSVGEIINALEHHELTNNTIIIFTTDNGPWLNYGNHAGSAGGLREGKATSWEGGQRVPCIMKWPGEIPAGTVCNKLACAIDLLPTLSSITGGALSKNKIDGVDLTPLLRGKYETSPRKTLLYYFGKNNLNAVRKGNWKLVLPHTYSSYQAEPGSDGYGGIRENREVKEAELYNMMRDPGEQYNVIEYHPEKAETLMKVAEKAREELGDLNVGMERGRENRAIGRVRE